jgi:hypothetical protein
MLIRDLTTRQSRTLTNLYLDMLHMLCRYHLICSLYFFVFNMKREVIRLIGEKKDQIIYICGKFGVVKQVNI